MQLQTNDGIGVNRKHKDTVFRMLFGKDKGNLLELYNALAGTSYDDEGMLEYTTLEDAVYMKHKNDVSFLVTTDDLIRELNLFEHQSTLNPNMPLRGFLYYADLYRQLIRDSESIYGDRLITIPRPRFIVFYNGDDEEMPKDEIIMRLSDAFEGVPLEGEKGRFEWTARVVNINPGHNDEITRASKTLMGYSQFVQAVRGFKETMPLEAAIDAAVDYCIENGYISEFLDRHRREVKNMTLTQFDEEKYIRMIRRQERDEGRLEGRLEGRIEGVQRAIMELASEGDITRERAAEKLEMEPDEFDKLLKEYVENSKNDSSK